MQTKTTRRNFIATLAATAAVPLLAKAGESTLVAPAVEEKGGSFSPLDLLMVERSKVISRTTSFYSPYTFQGLIVDACQEMLLQLREYSGGAFNPYSSECTLRLPAFGSNNLPKYLLQSYNPLGPNPYLSVLSVIKGLNPNMHIEYWGGEADIAKLHFTDADGKTWDIVSIPMPDIVHREL